MSNIQQTGQLKKSKRNSNTGSVSQLSKGKWVLKWFTTDQSGNRKRVSQVFQGSKTHANRKLRELITAVDERRDVEKSKETIKDFSTRWMATYVATNCTLRTAIGYQGNIDRYIAPAIGRTAVQNVTSSQIQAIYAGLLERGLSHTTVLHVHRVLKEMLAHALKWGMIAKNPADGATPPKREKGQMPMWDATTIRRFLDESKGTRYAHIFEFAVMTGMRRSEIAGLKWDAVDLESGRVEVAATLQQIPGHGLVTGAPKTKKSRRNFTLGPSTIELLRVVQGTQQLARIEAGPLWRETGYVFTLADGSPVQPDVLTKNFRSMVRELAMPPLSFHGLRHAFATMALQAGMNPKIVSEALGHSSVTITLDTYSHVLPNMQDKLAIAVENILKR